MNFTREQAEAHNRRHRPVFASPASKQAIAAPQTARQRVLSQQADSPAPPKAAQRKPKTARSTSSMNGTERRFSEMLELRRVAGEIKGWQFSPIRLKWGEDKDGNALRYLADFAIFENSGRITLCEVKNAWIWDDGKTRYKGCKAQWEQYFDFQFWQYKNKTWQKI